MDFLADNLPRAFYGCELHNRLDGELVLDCWFDRVRFVQAAFLPFAIFELLSDANRLKRVRLYAEDYYMIG